MTHRMVPELTVEAIDAYFSPNRELPKITTMPMNTLGVSGLGGYSFDLNTQRAVYSAFPNTQPIPSYKRLTPDAPQNLAYGVKVKREDDYEYQRRQEREMGSQSGADSAYGLSAGLETLTISSDAQSGADRARRLPQRRPDQFYEQIAVSRPHTYNTQLPITNHRSEIVNAIEANSIVLIKGSTGSGKTTQVPQFILDDATEKRRPCNIVVTQPRKIAAKSIAERVCNERSWQIGSVCGFQVGMEKMATEDTCLLYCTSGVLLQKMINDKSLNEFTHVVLDEIHERDSDLDFCLLVAKKLQRTVSPQVKLVLMSATMETDVFSEYFTQYSSGRLQPCPVLNVEGHMYAVTEWYSDQLATLANGKEIYQPRLESPKLDEETCHVAAKLITKFEDLELKEYRTRMRNRELAAQSGDSSLDMSTASQEDSIFRGSVLIFLPGLAEINRFYDLLQERPDQDKMEIITLHSSITLTRETVRKIFKRPPAGKRKVILATNIAESSITVPDVRYVIDFCLTKNLFCDPDTSYPSLRLEWASKSSCDQRRGRAGRVAAGRCYRMVPRQFYEALSNHAPPEMQRAPLDQLVLKAKILDLGDPKYLLGLAISPPNLDDIERSVLCLKEVGALTNIPVLEGFIPRLNPRFDGELTFLGRVMAQLPLDVHLSKLILLGHVFGILDDAIIMAASLNLGGFFSRPFRQNVTSFMAQLSWSNDSGSDVIAMLVAYRTWAEKRAKNAFKDPRARQDWGEKNLVSFKRIKEVDELVTDLHQRLEQFNIVSTTSEVSDRDELKEELLHKIIIAGAFYPNYFLREAKDEHECLRTMSGVDPFRSVMMTGLPNDQGPLYKDKIQEIVSKHIEANNCSFKYHFEGSKLFLEFVPSPGVFQRSPILPQVYMSVKMSRIPVRFEFESLTKDEARIRMEGFNEMREQEAECEQRLRTNRFLSLPEDAPAQGGHTKSEGGYFRDFPSVITEHIEIVVTAVVSVDHYFGIIADDESFKNLIEVSRYLNNPHLQHRPLMRDQVSSLKAGDFVAAHTEFPFKFCLEPGFYRAQVTGIKIEPTGKSFQVFFVDIGLSKWLTVENFLHIEQHILDAYPFLAFEFKLSHVKPFAKSFPRGRWTDDVIDSFKPRILGHRMQATIYSIVDNVIRCSEMVDLNVSHNKSVSLIDQLMSHKFCEWKEEPVASKMKHHDRVTESQVRLTRTNVLDTEDHANSPISDQAERANSQIRGRLGIDNDWQIFPANSLSVARGESQGSSGHRRLIRLHGPSNPLLLRFSSLNNSGRRKAVNVAGESINSVCLDDHPSDKHDRLLVAATVGADAKGDKLIPRDTTLMPMIPGLAAIVSLIFAPQAEFRTNPRSTHLTGALVGLGYNKPIETNESTRMIDDDAWMRVEEGPIFPDHDIELTFDAELTCKDIMLINNLRALISATLNAAAGRSGPQRLNRTVSDTKALQEKIRFKLLEILNHQRPSLRADTNKDSVGFKRNRVYDYPSAFRWNQVAEENLVVPYDGEVLPQGDHWILPLHCVMWTDRDQDDTASSALTSTVVSDTESETASDTASRTRSRGIRAVPDGAERDSESVSGFSIHSSEYCSTQTSRSVSQDGNEKRMGQLFDLKRGEEELRRHIEQRRPGRRDCKLCGFVMSNLEEAQLHIDDPNHQQRVAKLRDMQFAYNLK